MTLLELFGYLAELLSYYQDRAAAEARLATRRRSALALGAIAIALVVCRRRRNGVGDG